jgi:hypothetical protein
MPRYLYRVKYTYTQGVDDENVDRAKGSSTYEPVALDAADDAAALAAVTAATDLFTTSSKATRTITLVTKV